MPDLHELKQQWERAWQAVSAARGTPEYSARHNEALEIERQIAELRAKGDDRG